MRLGGQSFPVSGSALRRGIAREIAGADGTKVMDRAQSTEHRALNSGSNQLRGGDGLAGVALGVVGAVDEQAAEGGGKRAASHGAGLFRIGAGEGSNAAEGVVDAGVEFGEQIGFGGAGVELRLERAQLRRVQRPAVGVGEQPVEAPDDVAQVEGERGGVAGAGVEVGVGQGRAGGVHVLAREFERMDDGAEEGGQVGVGAAEPGFGLRHKILCLISDLLRLRATFLLIPHIKGNNLIQTRRARCKSRKYWSI